MNEPQNKELPILYKNYLKTCHLLELTGGVILIGAVLLNSFLHLEARGFVIPAALIGAVILALGASSIRPQNQVKAFAAQLTRTGDRAFAEGLLDALTKNRSVSVTKRTQNMVGTAILSYGAEPGADPELVKKLDSAAASCLKILKF